MNIMFKDGIPIGGIPQVNNCSIPNMVKLWENPSPTTTFVSQPVTLSSTDYDFLLIEYVDATANQGGYSLIASKGTGAIRMIATLTTTSAFTYTFYRVIVRTSDASIITFSEGYTQQSNAARTQDNTKCVPTAIYGFKKDIDLNAIVANVNTSASACMLSDNVTSVETAFTEAVKVVTASASMTIAANSYAVTNASFTLPTGYKAICACPLTSGSLLWSWSTCQLNNDGTVKMGINSRSSSSDTFDVKASIICIRA